MVRVQNVSADDDEVSILRTEIIELRNSKNKWKKICWQKNSDKFEKILVEWSGNKAKTQNEDKPNLLKDILPVALTLLAIGGVAIIVWRLVIFQRLKQRNIKK